MLLAKAMLRPFVLFAQEPIIQLFGVYLAFVYGNMYRESMEPGCFVAITHEFRTVVLTTLPGIYTEIYHQGAGVIGLHYIALVGSGLTSLFASLTCAMTGTWHAHIGADKRETLGQHVQT